MGQNECIQRYHKFWEHVSYSHLLFQGFVILKHGWSTPHPVTVTNEGLWGFSTKNGTILVVTVTG